MNIGKWGQYFYKLSQEGQKAGVSYYVYGGNLLYGELELLVQYTLGVHSAAYDYKFIGKWGQ